MVRTAPVFPGQGARSAGMGAGWRIRRPSPRGSSSASRSPPFRLRHAVQAATRAHTQEDCR